MKARPTNGGLRCKRRKSRSSQGFIANHAGQDRTRERIEQERDLATAQARLQEAKAALAETEQGLNAYRAETLRTLKDREVQADLKARQLAEEGTKAEKRNQLTRLTAPVAGTVQQLPYEGYKSLLQMSAVHVYLTYPFVLSWSMLEAMATGCLVIGSDTTPVREVLRHGVNGHRVAPLDSAQVARATLEALDLPMPIAGALRREAALGARAGYSVDAGLLAKENICKGTKPTEDTRHVA